MSDSWNAATDWSDAVPQKLGRLSDRIARDVVERVVSGAVPEGSALPTESALCGVFGVSRQVVREALKLVEQKGLVRIRQGEGTTVMPRGHWNLLDADVLRVALEHDHSPALRNEVIEIRRNLEAQMVRSACGELVEGDFAQMEIHLKLMDTSDDSSELQAADAAFHAVIHERSGRQLARTIVGMLSEDVRGVRYVLNPGRALYDEANAAHRAIWSALREGDADRAALAMERHITDQWLVRRNNQLAPSTVPEASHPSNETPTPPARPAPALRGAAPRTSEGVDGG